MPPGVSETPASLVHLCVQEARAGVRRWWCPWSMGSVRQLPGHSSCPTPGMGEQSPQLPPVVSRHQPLRQTQQDPQWEAGLLSAAVSACW